MGWFWIILFALAIYLIYINNQQKIGPGPGGPPETPLEILKKRYARGEITREQFEEIKRELE